ncbi:MAG TPA: hypothetical protein DD435_13050 [Cyanobacteria bacterium UBA8530]|nr:hypothetical protein [Cyanobacteria bacterium UBA8530]
MVSSENTAVTVGSGALPLYATPSLVALMEKAAIHAIQGFLPLGMTSVGTALNLRHLAATPIGHNIQTEAVLTAVNGRKLEFKIAAFDEKEKIGEATHERFVVSAEKFMDRMVAKKPKE